MSGCFDGRNGKSVKTSGDLKDLRDLCLRRSVGTGIVAVLPGKFFFKSLRNHTSHQLGGLFGGTLVIGLIAEPLGFVQDAQDVMVLFDEWLAVLELYSVRVLDELTAGRRRLYVMTAWCMKQAS